MAEKFRNKYRIKSVRLKHWDYAWEGYYFVTICVRDRINIFGEIKNDQMVLNNLGCVVNQCWHNIPCHFPYVSIDEYIVMPNHVHGIIAINGRDEAMPRLYEYHGKYPQMSKISPKAGSLSVIVGGFKSIVTRWAHENGYRSFFWQPRFHDHIIRNDTDLMRIRQYIKNNPQQWHLDEDNLG